MKLSSKLLEHPIVSTVIGGLVLSFLAWLTGYLPVLWQWIKDIFTSIYTFSTQDIVLPLWLVVLISIPFILRAYGFLKNLNIKYKQKPNNSVSSQEQHTSQKNTSPQFLSSDEINVMKLLVKKDGNSIAPHDIKYSLQIPMLKIEQIVESLEIKQFIEIHHNEFDGTSIWLTRPGRDYMMGNEYANT